MGAYEDTLNDIEKTFGTVPRFMRLISRESLVCDWPSWKRDNPGEMYLERARYLLNADDILEEMLSKGETDDKRKPLVGMATPGQTAAAAGYEEQG
jgi:hypothetical protein